MAHYSNSLPNTLVHLFPEINIDINKFACTLYDFILLLLTCHIDLSWKDKKNRRLFFEEFAKIHDFDPLDPNNWYSIPTEMLLTQKVDKRNFMLSLLFLGCKRSTQLSKWEHISDFNGTISRDWSRAIKVQPS